MSVPIPAADAIQVPWPYFKALLLVVFPIHLLFMNAVLGSTAIALYAYWKKGETPRRLAHELGKVLPILVAFTVNFGVAALLFLQVLYGQFFYTSSIVMGAFWLSVILLVMIAYYALYIFDFRFPHLGRRGLWWLGLALILFLIVPFLFTNNMSLMLRPAYWSVYFADPSGTSLNLGDATLIPRYLHMVVGGLAIGALFVAVYGRVLGRKDYELGRYAMGLGMRVFAVLTLVQMVVGMVFLVTLPGEEMRMFLGQNHAATAVLLGAFLLALLALAAGFLGRVVAAAVVAVPLVFLMTVVRAYLRSGFLQPYFHPASLKVTGQYSPMICFFIAAGIGILVAVWMIGKAIRIPAERRDNEG
jgi:hypothetical protein